MSRSTLYLIPPARLQRVAQHAEASSRQALLRGHAGAARLWKQIQERCLAALEDEPHDGEEVGGDGTPLRQHGLGHVEVALSPRALTGVGRSARKETVHTVAEEQGVYRVEKVSRGAGFRASPLSRAYGALATTVRPALQGAALAEVAR